MYFLQKNQPNFFSRGLQDTDLREHSFLRRVPLAKDLLADNLPGFPSLGEQQEAHGATPWC